jgi:hypothetical protein
MTVGQLVAQARTLSREEQVELLKQLVELVAAPTQERKKHSIFEFEGIAAHLADDEDSQDYVNRLRHEWDDPA